MTQTSQLGELLLQPTYKISLVGLSYCISVLGSFVALTAAQHISTGRKISWLNLLSAGAALGGIGVWSMHFTGMLALNLDMGSGYSVFETVISLFAAVGATSIALAYVAKHPRSNKSVLTAGGLLGLGVAVMHYLGMFGMRFPGYIIWSGSIITISVLIAIVAASAALWLAFRTQSLPMRGLAAIVMGIAVCSMHYTGMAAADFVCTSVSLQRYATPQGLLVVSTMDLPLLTITIAIGMAFLIGYDQLLQRTFGNR